MRVLLLFISLSISLFISEAILREINYPYHNCEGIYPASESNFAEFDPVLGWSYKKYKSTLGDYGVIYSINNEGYRSGDINDESDFNKPTILIVGDSMLFGHGLNFEDTFGFKLSQALGNTYQVLNFAVQAYGPDQMYLLLQKIFPEYHPEVVIADYISEHDMRVVSADRREIIPCLYFLGTKPVFGLKGGELLLKHKPVPYQIYDHPRIFLLLRRLFNRNLGLRANEEGRLISKALTDAIKTYVESQNSSFYLFTFDDPKQYQEDNRHVLGVTFNRETDESESYYLADTDSHPNKLATLKMVKEFLEKFEGDLGQS